MHGAHILRPLALLSGAVIAVHDLRYLLASGGDAGHALAEQGHAYMTTVTPLVGGALTLGVARMLSRAATTGGVETASHVRLRRVWPAAASGLLAVFMAQELLEGIIAAGHPSGLTGVLGDGGWVAIALAIAFGGLVALAMRVVRHMDERGPLLRAMRVKAAVLAELVVVTAEPRRPRRLLADHLAGRGPPALAN